MVTAIASGVATILPALQGIPNKDDPKRFRTAEGWYYAAIAGDQDALCQLKYMSGQFGTSPGCGKFGAGASGFATSVARQYAYDLYFQASQILSGALSPATPKPPTPNASSANVPRQVGGALSGVSSATGALSNSLGYPNQQQQAFNLLLIGVVVVGVVVLLKRG